MPDADVTRPTYTFALCTRNRADLLADAVRSAIQQAADDTEAEVLVVNNASTDTTPDVLASLRARYPALRVLDEPQPGLSIARNRALEAAKGAVVVFLDDDAVLCTDYLAALHRLWRKRQPACAGGPVTVAYLDPAPRWWTPAYAKFRGPVDLGPDPRPLTFSRYPEGCNIAFDRTAALEAGGFDVRLGVGPHGPWAGEETELCARLDRAGQAIWYDPALRVTHRVHRANRTPAWMRRMAWYRGRSYYYVVRSYFGRARWRSFFRQALVEAAATCPWHDMARQCRLGIALGAFFEACRRPGPRPSSNAGTPATRQDPVSIPSPPGRGLG